MSSQLPDKLIVNGQEMANYDFMLRPCDTKEALHEWIITYLGLDMPDCIVCDESTASPMDLIWNVYRAAREGDPKEASQLYFASRDSFKTLAAAVVEVLLMIHCQRTASHMGAIKQQSKKCYDYVKGFLRRSVLREIPQLKDTMERTELQLPTPWDMNPYLQIIVCTLQGANSEHTHLLTFDEVDTVDNYVAYREAKKIPTETPDKKPSITLYISTRKSSFGLVQREVDDAKETGLVVRSWNIIDVTQACPKSKNRMDEGEVTLYSNPDNLELISEEQYKEVPDIQKQEYNKQTMYKGCVGCSIAPLCLGRLATKQKSLSKLLKSHHDVEKKFRESETTDAVAQLMCYKPSTKGVVFTSFDPRKSVHTPTTMWERFTGEKATKEITKEELVATFKKAGLLCIAGVDWGWTSPSVCTVLFIDSSENIYVVHQLSLTHTDEPEFINIIKKRIHAQFGVEMYYPDIENPSAINQMKKADLPVSKKVIKDIHPGVQTIKRYIRVPGLNITKFFVLSDCTELLTEMGKYHLKLDAAGEIVSHDEYEDEFNHSIDSVRYPIHTLLGKINANIETSAEMPKDAPLPLVTGDGSFTRVPTAEELAQHLGVKFGEKKDPMDPTGGNGGGDPGGFSWSF